MAHFGAIGVNLRPISGAPFTIIFFVRQNDNKRSYNTHGARPLDTNTLYLDLNRWFILPISVVHSGFQPKKIPSFLDPSPLMGRKRVLPSKSPTDFEFFLLLKFQTENRAFQRPLTNPHPSHPYQPQVGLLNTPPTTIPASLQPPI